ncbi:MAG: hypothetical protein ACRD3S_15615, partial [Terracidiphilus sp.]
SSWLAWMDSAPVVFLGAISYSTYLYQEIAGGLTLRMLGDLPRAAKLIAALSATYLVATASYFIVEKPLLKLRARVTRNHVIPAPVLRRAASGVR